MTPQAPMLGTTTPPSGLTYSSAAAPRSRRRPSTRSSMYSIADVTGGHPRGTSSTCPRRIWNSTSGVPGGIGSHPAGVERPPAGKAPAAELGALDPGRGGPGHMRDPDARADREVPGLQRERGVDEDADARPLPEGRVRHAVAVVGELHGAVGERVRAEHGEGPVVPVQDRAGFGRADRQRADGRRDELAQPEVRLLLPQLHVNPRRARGHDDPQPAGGTSRGTREDELPSGVEVHLDSGNRRRMGLDTERQDAAGLEDGTLREGQLDDRRRRRGRLPPRSAAPRRARRDRAR